MQLLLNYLVIGLGGALGSMLRFGLGSLIDTTLSKGSVPIFPWGTILVNLTGCFVIGFVLTIGTVEGRWPISPLTRDFITIGMLGGFTTFSAFSWQTLALAQKGQMLFAAANVTLSIVLCLAGVWLGSLVAEALNRAR